MTRAIFKAFWSCISSYWENYVSFILLSCSSILFKKKFKFHYVSVNVVKIYLHIHNRRWCDGNGHYCSIHIAAHNFYLFNIRRKKKYYWINSVNDSCCLKKKLYSLTVKTSWTSIRTNISSPTGWTFALTSLWIARSFILAFALWFTVFTVCTLWTMISAQWTGESRRTGAFTRNMMTFSIIITTTWFRTI